MKPFAEMSEAEVEERDRSFIAAFEAGDDSGARESLAAGVPIYYAEEDKPADGLIKKYPDGRKQLVRFSTARNFSSGIFDGKCTSATLGICWTERSGNNEIRLMRDADAAGY